jgi:anti-anti-sigma regulatory factor
VLHSIDTFEGWHQVVFSLFGRKDKPDVRRTRGGLPVRIPDSTLRGPATVPSVEAQRELARRTAEKIDLIESEMIDAQTSLVRPAAPAPQAHGASPSLPSHFPASSTASPAVQQRAAAAAPSGAAVPGGLPRTPAPAYVAAPAPAAARPAVPALDPLEFDGALPSAPAPVSGIEVSASTLPPDLEEAAILYANGQSQAAVATLRASIARGGRDAPTLQAWRMLFDVLQASGARAEFDAVAIDYAARFEKSPPAWQESAAQAPAPKRVQASSSVVFPARLDATIHSRLETAQRAGAGRRPVSFDFRAVRAVDAQGAALVVSAVAALEKAGRELSVAGAGALYKAAHAAIETGRRDPGDGCWQLAMLGLRLMGDRQAFEDLSIDFCVTYEVSPPPWEALPACMRAEADGPAAVEAQEEQAVPLAQASADGGGFSLLGEIAGRMAAELESLREWAGARTEVPIDCRGLRRLDFVAAGELLNEVVTLCSAGRRVTFVEPGAMVESLMVVMGIHELADIRRRRI